MPKLLPNGVARWRAGRLPDTPLQAGPRRYALLRLLRLLWPSRHVILLAFAGMAVIAATDPALVWLVKQIADRGFSDPGVRRYSIVIPAALAALFALRGAAAFATGYLMLWVSSRMLTHLQKECYASILSASGEADVGRAINAIIVEGRGGTELVERVVIKFFRSLFSVLALLAYLFYTDAMLGALCLGFALPFIAVVRVTGERYARATSRYVALNSAMAGTAQQVMDQLALVRQYGAQRHEGRLFDGLSLEVNGAFRRMASTAGAMVPLSQFVAALFLALLFALRPALGGQITDGEFVAFVANLLLMMVPLRDLAEVNGAMLRGLVGALTVFSAADLTRERAGGQAAPAGAGRIEFEDVWFTYRGAGGAALRGLDLTIAPGETVAVIGQSGSGKSTLLKLIPELLRPDRGTIRLDGKPIGEIGLAELRARIAVVGQDVALFDDTLAANVSYGDAAPCAARVAAALEAAQLSALVATLPAGMATRLGRNGLRLSGGQRQLLAIARAFYRDAPILLLDEPTSALDHASGRAVQAALRRLRAGRTTLIVTHSMETLLLADRYILLEAGAIAATGMPAAPERAPLDARGPAWQGVAG